jgi:O-antigen/teichoic acid export membrane protein
MAPTSSARSGRSLRRQGPPHLSAAVGGGTGAPAPSARRLRLRPIHPSASGLLARLFSFVPTAIGTLLVSRLVIEHYGISAFNGFTIAESLIVLLPLNNLGVGAAITAAFASLDPRSADAERVTLTATRVMTVSALCLSAAAMVMAATGLWSTVLGGAAYGGWFFGLGMAFYAAGFVPGLGQAMLLGVHRNHVTILVQSLMMPAALGMVVVLIAVRADGRLVVVVPAAALAATNVVTMVLATRLTGFRWRRVLARVPRPRRHAGARIRGIAGPRLITNITVPLALASDLVVLSHFSSPRQLADYGICVQIFAPVTALVAAAAAPLWPIYIAAKAKGSTGPPISRTVLRFCVPTVVVCALLVPVAPWAGRVISDGQVRFGLFLPIAAALMTVIYSAAFPVGMALTTPKELRFSATVSLVALPLNVGASIVLAGLIGAPGPLLATAVVGLAQMTSAAYYLRTRSAPPAALSFPSTRTDRHLVEAGAGIADPAVVD